VQGYTTLQGLDELSCQRVCCDDARCMAVQFKSGRCMLKDAVGIIEPAAAGKKLFVKKTAANAGDVCHVDLMAGKDNHNIEGYHTMKGLTMEQCIEAACKDTSCQTAQFRSSDGRCILKAANDGQFFDADASKTAIVKRQ
jgi:hypothetical protein